MKKITNGKLQLGSQTIRELTGTPLHAALRAAAGGASSGDSYVGPCGRCVDYKGPIQ
jgi:hypothetical protein